MMWIGVAILGAAAGVVVTTVLLSWRRPQLGTAGGRLRACPASPNCVCSQDDDAGHHVEPFPLDENAGRTFERLAALIAQRDGARIVTQREGYLHAEFTTPLLRFVDDVELLLDREAGVIHVRSASRVGRSDFGANRLRIEELRAAWSRAD